MGTPGEFFSVKVRACWHPRVPMFFLKFSAIHFRLTAHEKYRSAAVLLVYFSTFPKLFHIPVFDFFLFLSNFYSFFSNFWSTEIFSKQHTVHSHILRNPVGLIAFHFQVLFITHSLSYNKCIVFLNVLGVTCFCSLQKCQMTNNLCTSYYGCYQMSIVVPEDPLSGDTEAATPSTYTALAACIESRSQNKTHCGPEQLYKQSSPNTVIKCCYKNLCNDITG